jgi:hypothetical protein
MRAFMAAAVEASSPGVVARQVGMSGGALTKFLDGGAPTPPTYRKLHRWYARRAEAALKTQAATVREPAPPAEAPVDEDIWTGDSAPPRVVLRYTPEDAGDSE